MKFIETKCTKALRDGAIAVILHLRSPMSIARIVALLFWIVPPCVQAFMATRMSRIRLHREFPLFFTYLVYSTISHVVTLAFYAPPYVNYFLVTWASEGIQLVLSILVIYEIYSRLFERYEGLRTLCNVLFQWSAAVLLLVGTISAAGAAGHDSDRVMAALLTVTQAAALLKTGLLLFLFLFARVFGLTWRHYVLGIALGLALYTSVDLVGVALRNHLGMSAAQLYSLFRSGAYNCGVLIWCSYFLSADRSERRLAPAPSSSLEEMERWNDALKGLLRR